MPRRKQILNSAGYTTNSSGKYLGKDGKPITFNINVVSGWTDWDQIVAIMVQNLNQLGLTVTANETQFAQYYSALQTGQFDTAISWTNQGPSPYYPLYGLLDSVNSAAPGQQATPPTGSGTPTPPSTPACSSSRRLPALGSGGGACPRRADYGHSDAGDCSLREFRRL